MQRKIKKNFAKIFGVILSLMMIVAMMPNVSAAIPVDNTLIINDGSVGNENELHKFYFSGDWTFGNNGACYNGDEHYIFERQINDTTYISIAFEGTGIELYASLKEIVVFVSSTMLSTNIVGSTSIPASISILLISNLGLVLSTTLIFTVNFLP